VRVPGRPIAPRRGRSPVWALFVLVACTASPPSAVPTSTGTGTPAVVASSTIDLDRDWSIQSSAVATEDGALISFPGFSVEGWYAATVPSTVLADLEDDGVYPDLYVGDNLDAVAPEAFASPWWYRTEFDLPAAPPSTHTFLRLGGVNYRAEVWLNGKRVASSDEVVGTFRAFELDVTAQVHQGPNALAIRVDPVDVANDLTITWIDWNPLAPDNGMGLWQPVSIARSGPVSIRDPFVETDLPLPATDSADLTVSATVRNDSDEAVTTSLDGAIGDVEFAQSVSLAPHEAKEVTFAPSAFPQLRLTDPDVWWPYQLGGQPLSELTLSATVGTNVSDTTATEFGVREIGSELMPSGSRRWLVNGVPILIRGAGWASDMLLRPNPTRVEQQLGYARDLGLNAIRLEGKLESDHFYDVADELGILVLPGWMCCDRWQESESWNDEEHVVGRESAAAQGLRLRNHPSVVGFLVGSDTNPSPDVEEELVGALQRIRWPTPILASASGDRTDLLGPTGVKMTGPYDWVPPGYWYASRADGGAWGFNTETSAGASIPELESVRRMLTPAEQEALWRSPSQPQPHTGTGDSVFNDFGVFANAMTKRLGAATSLADFVRKAQVLQYESERAMFESFGREKYDTATGVIQWMFNNAWPSLHWNLFDYYLEPNGSYFGAKKANEPVHIQYSYDDGSVVVVNQTPAAIDDLTARTRVYDLDGVLRSDRSRSVSLPADGVAMAGAVPDMGDLTSTYFVRLTLHDAAGALISTNTYWLSTVPETLAWSKSRWYYTPTERYADLTALSKLPDVHLDPSACTATDPEGARIVRVSVDNDTTAVAFFVRLQLIDRAGDDVVPVRWSDDDLTLMPGERRVVTASFDGASRAKVVTGGWNVPVQTLDRLPAC
jgi:exo-1,4-beta-D-glucosaminidase